jgi:GDPmannose 4,6-dehydratase
MRALITGVTGQDGSYLAELLLSKGYEVYGFVRTPEESGGLPGPVLAAIKRLSGEIDCLDDVTRVVRDSQPDECYHLAAQTFVPGEEFETMRINAAGTHHVLAAIRTHVPGCRLFLAGSSEFFGDAEHSPQSEASSMRPRSIYGISKLTAYLLMSHYRQTHGLHASCGILYNHESPRRGEHFVTRKITRAAASIKAGLETELVLGNLDSVRDWGHARDYVRAMWLMLQQPTPDDYVIATGHGRTVRDFVTAAFSAAGLDWQRYVRVAQEFYRPTERVPLVGSAGKANRMLKWVPEISFAAMVAEMVEHDSARLT